MTVRNLLSGATLAAAATMLLATSASAQYTFNVTLPTTGQVLGTLGSSSVAVTQISTNASVPLGFNSLTPFFNFNKNTNTTAGTIDNAPMSLTVSATKIGVGTTASQTINFTSDFNLSTTGNGGTTVSDFGSFAAQQFVFAFTDGSTLTLNNFNVSGATETTATGAAGSFGFNNATVTNATAAPEPGSLALAATGLMGAMGMVVRRRRSAK